MTNKYIELEDQIIDANDLARDYTERGSRSPTHTENRRTAMTDLREWEHNHETTEHFAFTGVQK